MAFARAFPIDEINHKVLEDNQLFKDLLYRWKPAGYPPQIVNTQEPTLKSSNLAPDKELRHLRLAIRDNYINFYRAGASLAQLTYAPGVGLQSSIHNKYVYGKEGSGDGYVPIKSSRFPDRLTKELKVYGGREDLLSWIDSANEHTLGEKKFSDLVIAQNSNVVDLEMGLNSYVNDAGSYDASQMDIVALEQVGNNWQIVFWEAKLVSNKKSLRRQIGSPPVVEQLQKYKRWIEHDNHHELVISAFQETCQILVKFHALAADADENRNIEPLGDGIVAAAKVGASRLLLDKNPRLLIDNRIDDKFFEKNGHLAKLQNVPGLHVQMVNKNGNMTLETLPSA